MSYYNYKYLSENKVGVGWLDLSDKINNLTSLSFSRNITEYWVQELSLYSLKMTCKPKLIEILNWAEEENLNYILVNSIGNNLSKNFNFIDELGKWLKDNKDFSIVGHILDRGNRYYQLHHQCFMININWWKSVGCPDVGKTEDDINWSAIEPIRSLENWHDDYTPHWIEQGTEEKQYTGRYFGWKLIKAALESDNRIYSFNEIQRDSKYYIYPEMEDQTYFNFHSIFNSIQSYCHFVANTETPPERENDIKFDGAICTAGGITPLLIAWTAQLKPGDMLTVFDVSPLALSLQKKLFDYKCNYRNFKSDFFQITKNFFDGHSSALFRAIENIDRMQSMIDSFIDQGLGDFIDNVWPTLDIKYIEYDIFDVKNFNMKLDISRFNNVGNVFIHLSNILYYINSAWIYNTESRYAVEKKIVDILYLNNPDKFYLYQSRWAPYKWKTITPRAINEHPELYLSHNRNLKILPWIKK